MSKKKRSVEGGMPYLARVTFVDADLEPEGKWCA